MVSPMVVVPYCIVINMMLLLYILRKKEELLVFQFIYVYSIFHIFNVYMPCADHSTDAYDMYYHVVNTVSLYCTNNNVDT